jgi:hypothetical protein
VLKDKQGAKAAFALAVKEFPEFIEGKTNLEASSK